MGPYLYDVRTEGGRGVPSKADIVIKLSKGGCVNLRTRGEGVQKSENFADVICVSPLSISVCSASKVIPHVRSALYMYLNFEVWEN